MKVAFATLGCKVNQYDSATIETAVRGLACEVVPFADCADVYVVYTCTVTDRADAESRQLARRARRTNPAARVIMTGCFVQTSTAVAAALPEVDYVIGIGRLPDMLRAVGGAMHPAHGRVFVDDVRKSEQVGPLGAEVFAGQTRAFLKIQEGCDLFCTFCIVPFARGRSRSVEPRRVLAELERLSALGFQEVVLTGIHLGGYGADLQPRLALADLVEMIAERRPVARVRLSSIDPPEVSARLLALIARSDVLCPHVHMPVQAATDTVLRRMRRRYDSALVSDVLAEIGRTLPAGGLGTDLIAGFPGETEAEFAAGYERLAGASFTYFHVFPYSRRRGTTAAKMRDAVPATVSAARARALRQLGTAKRRAFAARWVGRDAAVLLENTRDRASGCLVGYSREYLRVTVDGPDDWINREITVRVRARDGERAVGGVHTAAASERADAIGD